MPSSADIAALPRPVYGAAFAVTEVGSWCSWCCLAVTWVRYRGLDTALERKRAERSRLEHSAVCGAKADRALVLGNAGVEFDGFAAGWFRRIMCVFGTGLRLRWNQAPVCSRRPHQEVAGWSAKAAVEVFAYGTCALQP